MSDITLRVTPGAALAASADATPIELRPKERVVAAALALHHPAPVALQQLIGLVWPGAAPATAQQSIHNHLARLRATVPGLLESVASGYVLGDDVTIDVDDQPVSGRAPVDADYLLEFDDIPELRRARAEFVRRHVSTRRTDPTDLLRSGADHGLVAPLEEAVQADPGDERAWWLLAIATTQATGLAAGNDVITRARRALSEAGLGLGRRLLDLDGMLRDGVDDVQVLLRDPHGGAGIANRELLDEDLAERIEGARATWTEHERFLISIRGADSALRRLVVARLIDDVRASGFSTAFARHVPGDIGPPTLRTTHRGVRPIVMVVDGFDGSDDPVKLAERVTERLPSGAVGWVMAESPEADISSSLHVSGLADTTPTYVVDVLARSDVDVAIASPVERASGATLRLARLLAAIGEPIVPDHLDRVAPGAAAAALDAARAGLVGVDAATNTVDLASNAIAIAVLDALDDSARRSLAIDLLSLELPALDDARRCERRSRWSIDAYGADDDRAVAHCLEAANAYGQRGEYDVAAAVIRRMLDLMDSGDHYSPRWCGLAVHAGRALLAGGDPAGDALLADVVAAAARAGDEGVAALATHEWCRLGTGAGAGSTDDERLAVTTELLAQVTAPADRARVGAASAMVLSLAGDPDLLRRRFVGAVADAKKSGDPTVMADVLPLAYMSVPLHSDLDERLEHAATLLTLADELDRPDSRWEALQIRYSTEVMGGDPAFRSTLRELNDVASKLHERSREWEMHYIRSNLAIIDGDLERARREVDESLSFGGQVNDERVAAVFGAHHLVASMVEGAAAELLDPVRALATDQPGIGAWHAALAVSAAAAGEQDEAVEALRRVAGASGTTLVFDPVYSAGLVAVGEAAAATGDRSTLDVADGLLAPLAGMWSWCGSCTFGPIDLTRARVAQALGDRGRAEQLAADAVVTSAEMRAPVFAQQATDLLLSMADESFV